MSLKISFLWVAAVLLVVAAAWLAPPRWWPPAARDQMVAWFGPPAYRAPPPTAQVAPGEAEPACPDSDAAWRAARNLDGVEIESSVVCRPDNPAAVAAFVKGTNGVSAMTLMATRLAPDAVVKGNDRDGDGDPDEIHICLEVSELNGASPDITEPVPGYAIAPGIKPGFWVFSPKARGMATENFSSSEAQRMLRPPSPVIRVEVGDTVKVTLENTHYMPHTIHFHGVDHPFLNAEGEGNDGVPQTSEMPLMPGEARTYEMTPRQAGTMFYHCHVQPSIHILMGLQGMFEVEENRPNNWLQTLNVGAGQVRHRSVASRARFDREYDMHYQDIDNDLHELISQTNDPRLIARNMHRLYDTTERTADYFLLNGRSFPYTFRESLVVVAPNERVKLRVLNGGVEGISLHTHGHKATITHYDGVPAPAGAQITRDVFWISAAQRLDLELETVNDGLHNYGQGIWLMHDHRETAVTNDGISPGGNVSAIVYESFLDERGWPKTRGVDWTPYFTAAYYDKKIPVWAAYDPSGMLGDPLDESMVPLRPLLFVFVLGLLAGVAVLLVRTVARPGRPVGHA